ncbi:hypothetical protein BS78_07G192000 [Paspalum vaginatum]|nr:hypothetical protein BS78_07G192000 [Paspalum vaginatum]
MGGTGARAAGRLATGAAPARPPRNGGLEVDPRLTHGLLVEPPPVQDVLVLLNALVAGLRRRPSSGDSASVPCLIRPPRCRHGRLHTGRRRSICLAPRRSLCALKSHCVPMPYRHRFRPHLAQQPGHSI